jgi:hypothetical protein
MMTSTALAIQHGRREAPLIHGVERRLIQQTAAIEESRIGDGAVLANRRLDDDDALDLGRHRDLRIDWLACP